MAVGDRRLHGAPGAQQVALAHADFRDQPIDGRIAAGNGKIAGQLLLDIDVDDDAVGRRAGLLGDFHGLEIVQILEPPLGAVEQHFVERVAFGDIELAPDDVIAGAGVAADVDPFDIGARPLVDHIGEVYQPRLVVAVGARMHLREGIAALRRLDREVLGGLLDRFGVVGVAGARLEARPQRGRVDVAHVRLDVDGAEAIRLAFLEREGDEESFLGGVELRHRRDDLGVGVAVLEIEPPQQIAVGFDPVRVVDVGALEEAENIGFAGLDYVAQLPRRIGAVADEADLADHRLLAVLDFEHQVHPVVRPLDDFRVDVHVVATAAPVDGDDPFYVGVDQCARERAARLRLDFAGELLVFHPLVAFEGDFVDDRCLDDRDDQPPLRLPDVHVGEQPGGVKGLERVVDFAGVEPLARNQVKIRAHGVGFDTVIAFHRDLRAGG